MVSDGRLKKRPGGADVRDDAFGLVIVATDDEAEATATMAVVHGLMQATLYPYRIAATRV